MDRKFAEHLRKLAVDIGPRPTGSPGNLAAGEYIAGVFTGLGFEVEKQSFDFPEWHEEETSLIVRGESLPVSANIFSPIGDISAPIAPIAAVRELEKADLAGKIAVLYGELTIAPLLPKEFTIYTSERDQKIVSLLEEKNPSAIITVCPEVGKIKHIIEDWVFDIPSATVPAEAGLKLVQDPGDIASLTVRSSRSASTSANIIGRRHGSGRGRVVLCAHYDTKFGAPGALDNAAGVAALVEIAGRFSGMDLQAGLELAAFTDHEIGGNGTTRYVEAVGDGFGDIIAAINMDGVAGMMGPNSIAVMAASEQFERCVSDVTGRHTSFVTVEPWVESDHSVYWWRGVPSIALSSVGAANNSHSTLDTIEWVSVNRAEDAVSLVMEIVRHLSDKTVDWTRPVA